MMAKQKAGSSLQDQLRAAGLVTQKQVKKAKKGQHRKDLRVKQGLEVDESRQEALQAQEDKAAQDLEKNKIRDKALEDKAIAAQIKQLINSNAKREKGDLAYNFTENKKVKKIYISEENKRQLNKGYLAIVSYEDGYNLVPEIVAKKIQERDESMVLYLYDRDTEQVDEDDPYKDFQIPDDLEW